MIHDSSTSPSREQALAEAMDWLMRFQAEPHSDALQARHRQWLAADSAHDAAWQHAQHTWQLLQQLPATGDQHLAQGAATSTAAIKGAANNGAGCNGIATSDNANSAANDALAAPVAVTPIAALPAATARKRPLRYAAAWAAAACLVLMLLPGVSLHWRADHITGTGITRQLTLADGSSAYLGADSAISVHFSEQQRHIRLLRGEVFFDVTSDPQRPFVVHTDTLAVTVLGTRFNVAIGELSQTVAVASGKVQVADRRTGAKTSQLLPGDQLSLYRDGSERRASVALADVGAWRDQRLFVQDAAIADVAATLQRYQLGHTFFGSGQLAQQRITGAFDLSTPERALDSLVAPYQGRVLRVSPLLRVVLP